MKKIFISQPMFGKSTDQIMKDRKRIIEEIKTKFQDDVKILDSIIRYIPRDATPLWFLGKSIEVLSKADIIYMGKGWQNSRGCRIEYECTKNYGIQIVFEEENMNED